MSKLDLEWVMIFDEIYRSRSVSTAATRRGLSQPAASHMLNNLRSYYGDELFTRTSSGMEPTPFAELIAPDLRQVVVHLTSAESAVAVFDAASDKRTFRLCMTDISEIVLLPRLLAFFGLHAPWVSVITEVITVDSASSLQVGDLDLAIGFLPQLQSGFFQQTLFEQDFVCLAARSHPRIGDSLTREQYEAEAHAVVATPNTGHGIIDKHMKELDIARKVSVQPSTFLSLGHIVAKTDLLALVPRLLGQTLAEQAPLKLLSPPFPLPKYEVKQHWHARYHAEPGNQWLRRTLGALFGGGSMKAAEVPPD